MTKTKFSKPRSSKTVKKGEGLSSYMGEARKKDFILCSECGMSEIPITSKVFSYSSEHWGRPVCWLCQKKLRGNYKQIPEGEETI
jgi:hypothetical protein